MRQAVVWSCLGWRLGECLHPCQSHSTVKIRDRWLGWPTLHLSACQCTHHSPTSSNATESLGETTVFYRHFKKTSGTDSSKCDTLTRDILFKTQVCHMLLCREQNSWRRKNTAKTNQGTMDPQVACRVKVGTKKDFKLNVNCNRPQECMSGCIFGSAGPSYSPQNPPHGF